MARRKNRKPSSTHQIIVKKKDNTWSTKLKKLLIFLISSSIFLAFLKVTYQYFAGNIFLEFVQTIGKAYEFQLKNDTPADFTVKSFRIKPPRKQDVVYTITEDVYANIDNQGRVSLPGGNIIYVPAAEFKELDGQKLSANSSFKFRIPPLSSRTWAEPEAAIVDVHYELEPSNHVLLTIEKLLNAIGIHHRVQDIRYLVIDNYWTISPSTSINEAIHIFCRDNESMARSSICMNVH